MRVAAAVLLVACSHAAPPAPQAPPRQPPACERVSDHLVSLMSAASTATDEEMDPVRNVITRHCEQDLWTSAVQQCLLDAHTLQDSDHCEGLLTPAQQDALSIEFRPPAKQATPAAAAAPAPAETTAPPPTPPPAPTGDPCEGGQ